MHPDKKKKLKYLYLLIMKFSLESMQPEGPKDSLNPWGIPGPILEPLRTGECGAGQPPTQAAL